MPRSVTKMNDSHSSLPPLSDNKSQKDPFTIPVLVEKKKSTVTFEDNSDWAFTPQLGQETTTPKQKPLGLPPKRLIKKSQ
jgi:hypothetical protein